MSSDLDEWVHARLAADEKLSEDAQLRIMEALAGPDKLAELTGRARPLPAPAAVTETAAVEPTGAFLKRIEVRGFRGIGPESALDLDPGPGLTVISGRNGSGKSSFAEALEVALTSTSYRWRRRSGQWSEQWRNLHVGSAPRIRVRLAEEGAGHTDLGVDWPVDGKLEQAVTWAQRHGRKREPGLGSLGWEGPLETFRPLLTYEELGALLTSEPSALHDALSSVLGLDQLSTALKALDSESKEAKARTKALKADNKELRERLAALQDDRATEAVALLSKRVLDIPRLRQLATGTGDQDRSGGWLRELAAMTLPTAAETTAAAAELEAAVGTLAAAGDRVGAALEQRTELLAAAISLHEHDGDQDCPVCGTGRLDTDRVRDLATEVAQQRAEIDDLRLARDRHRHALASARDLVTSAPAGLDDELASRFDSLTGPLERVRQAWQHWARPPADPQLLAGHLREASRALRDALSDLQPFVTSELAQLDEAWAGIATGLAAHADRAQEYAAHREADGHAITAHDWLKDHQTILKNERIEPIADEARRIWAALRQESNVEIGGITLAGTATRRHVSIAATVDGEDAGALSVMSQGELHALALALFLPRATASASPFRFVVLDDPVQAMDPAKVDGLVSCLLELARTRQVVVFSHDDRFASAVRRSPRDVPVKILEVSREANSAVTTEVSFSPAKRYLRDAWALTKDEGVPDETRDRVLPGLFRMAMEAQARETFFGRVLSAGTQHADAEREWDKARGTRARLALALNRDDQGVKRWLDALPYRSRALWVGNRVHDTMAGTDPQAACGWVKDTVADLSGGVR